MKESLKLIEQTRSLFKDHFKSDADLAVAAPGRSNLIGEHTDYNDGHVLPIAIDRFCVAAAKQRTDRHVRLVTANLKESFEFDLDHIPEKVSQWIGFAMGQIIEMDRAGYHINGKDILIFGNVPLGSGISSSAALQISVGTVVERLDGHHIPDGEMVDISRKASHHFVGVKCGPMDQFASRACKAGHAGLLDCRSLEMTHHPLPEGLLYLSIYSGIPRALADSEYNERFESCQKAVEILQIADPNVKALRDVSPELVDSRKGALGDIIYKRARHVVTEEKRTLNFVEAAKMRNLEVMGKLLREGHYSLSRDYEVSLPLLDEMIEWLYEQDCVGARLTGAGFGGSLICVIEEGMQDPEKLTQDFIQHFQPKTPENPEMWLLTTVDGARYQPEMIS